jgi:hypothetical protein
VDILYRFPIQNNVLTLKKGRTMIAGCEFKGNNDMDFLSEPCTETCKLALDIQLLSKLSRINEEQVKELLRTACPNAQLGEKYKSVFRGSFIWEVSGMDGCDMTYIQNEKYSIQLKRRCVIANAWHPEYSSLQKGNQAVEMRSIQQENSSF